MIYDLLIALDTSKSIGCDGISAKMLKFTAGSIAPTLTTLFNLSICSGIFPAEWKLGRIVPVPKGTDGILLSGYRPRICHVQQLVQVHNLHYCAWVSIAWIPNAFRCHHSVANFQGKQTSKDHISSWSTIALHNFSAYQNLVHHFCQSNSKLHH